MLLNWLTYIVLLIIIPDYVFSQTVSEENIPCEYGWFNFKQNCFKVSGATEGKEWQNAADHCATLGANLATIESKEENDFLVYLLLLEIQTSAWIGLHDQVNESDYQWQSGSKSEYRNWRAGEPSGAALEHEDCAHLIVDFWHDSVGEWNDNGCKVSMGYICEKKSNPDLKSPNLKNCSAAEGGGFRFQSSCYHVVTDTKSWEEAEQHCINNYDGHLITILDRPVDFYLKYLFQGIESEFWIGIKLQSQFQQKWTSGWYVGYNGFSEEYPDFVEGTCAIRKHRKEWDIVPCSRSYPFICEKSKAKPPVMKLPTEDAICPSVPKGWRDMGGEICYYIERSKTVFWHEANEECMQRGGSLLILHSKEESDILLPFIQYSHAAFFVGLRRDDEQKKVFKWADGSQIDFENWNPGEPNSESELCVEARSKDLKWNDIDCNRKRPYICSVRKIISNSTTQTPFVSSVTPSSTTAGGFNGHFEVSLTPSSITQSPFESTVTPSPSRDEHFDDHLEVSSTPNSDRTGQSDDQVKVSGNTSRKIIIGVIICISIVIVLIFSFVIYKLRLCRKEKISSRVLKYNDTTSNAQDI